MSWISCHLHVDGGDDPILRWAMPAVGELLGAALIDRYFFVRYALGGLHLRLRVRLSGTVADGGEGVRRRLRRSAEDYLESVPGSPAWSADEVRRRNRAILRHDPDAGDDEVVPPRSVRFPPTRFEVERYGGHRLLAPSLDLFTLSSAAVAGVLRQVAASPERRPGLRLSLLFHLARGLAGSGDELLDLVAYGTRSPAPPVREVVARADAVLARRGDHLGEALAGELEAAGPPAHGAGPAVAALRTGAGLLARAVSGMPAAARHRLLTSHLHMTANRLGCENLQESYLSRLLTGSCERLARSRPDLWERAAATGRSRSAADDPAAALASWTDRWLQSREGAPGASATDRSTDRRDVR